MEKLKNSFEKKLKNWYAFWQTKLKIGTPFGTFTRHVEKLAPFWQAFDTLARLLAHWHVGALFFYIGTWASGHVGHSGTHGTHDK